MLKENYQDGDAFPAKDLNAITTLVNGLSADGGITEVKVAASLPASPGSKTLYLVDSGSRVAKEPYVEETYDANGNLIKAVLYGHTKVRNNAFIHCSGLSSVSIPNSVTEIGVSAFYECSNMQLTSIQSSIKTIKSYAFCKCLKLVNLTFEGTPTSIDATAFNNCTNLTTINVPWAEGAVANAPWGATNATINYNYTGGAV